MQLHQVSSGDPTSLHMGGRLNAADGKQRHLRPADGLQGRDLRTGLVLRAWLLPTAIARGGRRWAGVMRREQAVVA